MKTRPTQKKGQKLMPTWGGPEAITWVDSERGNEDIQFGFTKALFWLFGLHIMRTVMSLWR